MLSIEEGTKQHKTKMLTAASGGKKEKNGRQQIAEHLCNLFRIQFHLNCNLQAICTALSLRSGLSLLKRQCSVSVLFQVLMQKTEQAHTTISISCFKLIFSKSYIIFFDSTTIVQIVLFSQVKKHCSIIIIKQRRPTDQLGCGCVHIFVIYSCTWGIVSSRSSIVTYEESVH